MGLGEGEKQSKWKRQRIDLSVLQLRDMIVGLFHFIFTIRMVARLKNFKSYTCWLRDKKQKSLAISHCHALKSPTYYLESDTDSKDLLLCHFISVESQAFLEQLSFSKRWEV